MTKNTITPEEVVRQIYVTAISLLEKNPEGFRWLDLNDAIKEVHPDFHPNVINASVMRLPKKFPEKVVKTEEGVFKAT